LFADLPDFALNGFLRGLGIILLINIETEFCPPFLVRV
jgi:hypothetical protein